MSAQVSQWKAHMVNYRRVYSRIANAGKHLAARFRVQMSLCRGERRPIPECEDALAVTNSAC
jgi:hypothetical protein